MIAQLYSVTSAHGGMVIPRTAKESALSDGPATYWVAQIRHALWQMGACDA